MKTRTSDMPARPGRDGFPMYRPVAVRSALAAIVVVALLYCLPFMRSLSSTVAAAVSFVGILVFLGLGWMALSGSFGSLIRRPANLLGWISQFVLYVIAPCLYQHFAGHVPFTMGLSTVGFLVGFLVLLGLWWAGVIGAVGSLTSREAHPLYALALLAFFVAGAWLMILWISGHHPYFPPSEKV